MGTNDKIPCHQLRSGSLLCHHHWHLQPGEALPWHRHGFAELFWIEQGQGWHEYEDGSRCGISTGDLVFMPTGSAHRLHADRTVLAWANITINSALEQEWRQRYRRHWQPWPWDQAGIALTVDDQARHQLTARLIQLTNPETSLPVADSWFLHLLQLIGGDHAHSEQPPTWLEQALQELRTPAGLQAGLTAVVHASGRSHDHLARVVKRCYGMTPSLLVRRIRLDHAAALLRTTGTSIIDIALDCGFDNPSYFTRSFKQRFSMTPKAYRRGTPAIGSALAS